MQRKSTDEQYAAKHLDYWKQQLAGLPTVLDLPLDYPRPAVQGSDGATVSFTLSQTLTGKLRQLSQDAGSTLYSGLLGAFAILLSRYSAQQDIVIGSPTANRSRSDVESMIGLFVNTLIMRVPVDGDSTYLDLLQQVKQLSLAAFEHEDVPFEKLVEVLSPVRSMSHSPLFQVMFVLQPQDLKAPTLPDLDVSIIEVDDLTAKFDLTLDMREGGDRLFGSFNYRTDLFSNNMIEQIIAHLVTLLNV